VFFNGSTAATAFHRQFAKRLPPDLAFASLPSTSPAHAGLALSAKIAAWRAVGEALQQAQSSRAETGAVLGELEDT
jgi:G:T/U-mismatch repair DNA glycosylase